MLDDSFIKSLFHGVLAEGAVFPFPSPASAEMNMVVPRVEELRRFGITSTTTSAASAGEGNAAGGPTERPLTRAELQELAAHGLFGLHVPTELGGQGLSHGAQARMIQELAAFDPSRALAIAAHATLATEALLLFGTDAQKQDHLPAMARGESIGAFALAEEGAGSDAGGVQTFAQRHAEADGKPAYWILDGTKTWVTNGPIADQFLVFARTSTRDERAKPRITAFLVSRGPGVETGPPEEKLGVRGAPTSEVRFTNVHLTDADVVGEVGRGFKVAMEVSNRARVTFAAAALGQAKRLIKMAVERAESRAAFGREISQFALTKDKVARMMADVYAIESIVYLTTAMLDADARDAAIECAVAKVFASEALARVAEDSASIAAALGYSCAAPWERHLRDARVHLIFPGTNDILRCFIALSGMQGPGREISEVTKAMREPIKGFGLLTDFAVRKARSALGRERITRAHPSLARESLVLEENVAELAKNVDKVLRKHGKDIAEMQFSQKRAADIAIDLYAIAAVVARTSRAVEKRGEEGARRELGLVAVFVASAERRLAENVAAFEKNDDEVRKAIADKAYVDGGYPFDLW